MAPNPMLVTKQKRAELQARIRTLEQRISPSKEIQGQASASSSGIQNHSIATPVTKIDDDDDDEGIAGSPECTPKAKENIRQTLFSEASLMSGFAEMLKAELNPMKDNIK